MHIADAQKELRHALLGGFAGQLVSGLIWLAAAAVSVLVRPRAGMAVLFFGSMGIFPLTQLTLRLMGRNPTVSPENKLWGLGSQIAFTVPIGFFLVIATTLYREAWYFPAAMILVGAHYLPFIFLYGMRMFAGLAALLVGIGFMLALYGPPIFSLGGWIAGALMIVFGFLGRRLVLREAA
jgi:hypothetical protein